MKKFALAFALVMLHGFAQAQNQGQLPLLIGSTGGGTSYSVPIQTLLFFTALSFLPAVLLMMTGFTRIVIVLSLLRQAIGTQSTPPNQVIIGLSLFLTFFLPSWPNYLPRPVLIRRRFAFWCPHLSSANLNPRFKSGS